MSSLLITNSWQLVKKLLIKLTKELLITLLLLNNAFKILQTPKLSENKEELILLLLKMISKLK